jgi:hypothetical protein
MSDPYKAAELTDKVFEKVQRLNISAQDMSRLTGVGALYFEAHQAGIRRLFEHYISDPARPGFCWGDAPEYKELLRFVEETDAQTAGRLSTAPAVHPSRRPPEPSSHELVEQAVSRGEGWVWAFIIGLVTIGLAILSKIGDVQSSPGTAALEGMAIAALVMIGAYVLRRHNKSKEELRAKLEREVNRHTKT